MGGNNCCLDFMWVSFKSACISRKAPAKEIMKKFGFPGDLSYIYDVNKVNN